MICNRCGFENKDDSKFCVRCGSKLEASDIISTVEKEVKQCPNCGKHNDLNNKFCVGCGNDLSYAQTVRVYVSNYSYQAPKEPEGYSKDRYDKMVEEGKESYKYHKLSIITLILSFASLLLPILGQLVTLIMGSVCLIFAIKSIKENKADIVKISLVMSIISLVVSLLFLAVYIIGFFDFINIPNLIEPIINDGEGGETLLYIFRSFIR